MATKTILKKDFIAAVMHEINMLKKHLTKDEKKKLNITSLDPNNTDNCIYGQATGSCESKRAKKLMKLCCIRQYNFNQAPEVRENAETFKEVAPAINGKYDKATWGSKNPWTGLLQRNYRYLSALEGYIKLKNSRETYNKQIIEYIRGERKTLNLK